MLNNEVHEIKLIAAVVGKKRIKKLKKKQKLKKRRERKLKLKDSNHSSIPEEYIIRDDQEKEDVDPISGK